MSLTYAIDVSNFQPGDLSAIIAQHQPQHVVVRASTESSHHRQIARQQLRSALDAGCSISVYVWAYFDLPPVEHMANALSAVDGFSPARVWIDCEDVCPPGKLDHWLSQAADLAEQRGHRCGVYTSRGWWQAHGDSHGFARLPLWTAQWDEVPTMESVALYGGWDVAGGKQWSTTGGTLDRDVFDSAVLAPADPCAALKASISAELAALTAALAAASASADRIRGLVEAG